MTPEPISTASVTPPPIPPVLPDTPLVQPKKNIFRDLTQKQKISIGLVGLLAIALPIAIFAMSFQTDLRSRAATSTIPPIIVTDSMPTAYFGTVYRATITGKDIGTKNTLQMNITGLPAGFKLDPGTNPEGCTISGSITPTSTTTPTTSPTPTIPTRTPTPTSVPGTTEVLGKSTDSSTGSGTPSTTMTPIPPIKAVITRSCTILGKFMSNDYYPFTVTLTNTLSGLGTKKTLSVMISRLTPPPTPTTSTTSTPTPTPPSTYKISWKTKYATLVADEMIIYGLNKEVFRGIPDPNTTVTIGSDPGSSAYTTLEAMWTEKGDPMRLYVYFKADKQNWWSPEFRTYNGTLQGDWIYYSNQGKYFMSPIGKAYIAPLIGFTSNDNLGSVSFKNLFVSAFTPTPVPSTSSTATPTPTPTPTN